MVSSLSNGHRPQAPRPQLTPAEGKPPTPPRDAGSVDQTEPQEALPLRAQLDQFDPTRTDPSWGSSGLVEIAMQRASVRRLEEMRELDSLPSSSPITPEDGTLDTEAFHLSIATSSSGPHRIDRLFLQEMLRVAEQEGAGLVVRTNDPHALLASVPAAQRHLVQTIQVEHRPDGWVEDHGEIRLDGSVAYPALVEDSELGMLTREGRTRRDPERTWSISSHGAMNRERNQTLLAELALARGTEAKEMFGYLEGGNVLSGTRADGTPYALVSRDAVEVTRGLLEQGLGAPPSEDRLMLALSQDLGVPPEAVIPVEQPGDFHIDMYMSLLPGGKVLVNDAQKALDLQTAWLQEDHEAARPLPPTDATPEAQASYEKALAAWNVQGTEIETQLKSLKERTDKLVEYEHLVLRDLEAQGLDVYRIAGTFKGRSNDALNFLNAELGQGADGKTFSVMLGGDPRAQAAYQEQLESLFGDEAPRIHFLDPELTDAFLAGFGAVSCKVKSSGTLAVSPQS